MFLDRYDLYNSDIFATNVIAKDPYTGRQVQLIDSRGYVQNQLSLKKLCFKFKC